MKTRMQPSVRDSFTLKLKKRFLPHLDIVQSAELRPYVVLITVSVFSFALGVGSTLPKYLSLTYHGNSGVVGWISANQYPKHQEFFYFLLALLGIPAAICLYWLGWQNYSNWAAKLTAQPVQHVLKANALASLPLCICWVQLFYLDGYTFKTLIFLIVMPITLVIFVKLGLLYNRFLPHLRNVAARSEQSIGVPSRVGTPGSASHPKTRMSRQAVRIGVEYILLPIFIYVLTYSGNIDGNIDLFHEGERLAPLNEMLRGGIPFRDIYVQHGLFQNAGLAWVGSQIFEPTLMGVRTMEAVLSPLGYVALYLLSLQIFRARWLTALICVLIASGTNFWVSPRHGLGLLSFAMMGSYLTVYRRNRFFSALAFRAQGWHRLRHHLILGWRLLLAGIFTNLAFWYSTEIGLYSLGGIGLFLLMYSLQNGIPMQKRFLPLIYYLCGVLLGFLPIGIYFLWHGALDDMFWNTYIQCRYQLATWGLAFPSLSKTLATLTADGWGAFLRSEGFRWYLPVGVFLVVSAYLTYRWLRQELWNSEGATKLLLLLLGGITFFRTALGRSDGGHLIYGATFLWILCLLPLERGVFSMARPFLTGSSPPSKIWVRLRELTRWRAVLRAAWILIPLSLFFHYVGEFHQPLASFEEKWQRLGQNPFKRAITPEELMRAGRVDIPDGQVEQIQKVVMYIQEHTAPNEKIFDFTSQGAYYFFANRPSVTRFHQISYASTPEMERETILALEREQPRLVLFKTGGWFDAVDGIPVEERHPLTAQYLHDNYKLAIDINGTQILRREKP